MFLPKVKQGVQKGEAIGKSQRENHFNLKVYMNAQRGEESVVNTTATQGENNKHADSGQLGY